MAARERDCGRAVRKLWSEGGGAKFDGVFVVQF